MMRMPRRGLGLGALAGIGAAMGAATLPRPTAAQAQAEAPPPAFHRFRVGGFTVTTLFDGTARLPLEGMVVNAPAETLRGLLAEAFLPTDGYVTPYTVTLLQAPGATVLFDAGTGGQLSPQAGRMAAALAAAGVAPGDVTHVVLTHCHGDHITGLTTAAGQAVFPRAELVVPEAEWRFWTDAANEAAAPQRQRPNFANVARRFAPYADRLRRVADGQEALPGVRALVTPGHTPGHTSWHLADGGAECLVLGDVTHRPEVFARRPDLHVMFDFDPATAQATRRRLLDRLATDRVRVTGYHFPFPANGAILRDGEGYRFLPADPMA